MRSITRASLSPFLLLVGITLIGTGNLPAASAESTPALVTHVTVKGDTITFHTAGRHASVRMVVMGPEDWYRDVTFAADAAPTLAVTDQDVDGRTMSDGLYSVELMATPRIPRKIRAQLQAQYSIDFLRFCADKNDRNLLLGLPDSAADIIAGYTRHHDVQ